MQEPGIKSTAHALSRPLKIAFVSGKGGVGKTMLASNFAWVCSHLARTLLVDLDFQNQGLKGLFAPHVEFSRANALDAIQDLDDKELQLSIEVSSALGFLPSVSWQQKASQDEIAQRTHADGFQKRLGKFIEKQWEEQGFDIIVLDCHGGVDPVSLAAFEICNQTLMVTEADSVTFNGTLELLDYYDLKSRERQLNVNPAGEFDRASIPAVPRDRPEPVRHVQFIVNRLRSKYRWKDLERIYQGLMKEGLGSFSRERSVLCYIPVEDSLADSFGEYPFYVKLAPNSIFSRKIHLMVSSVTEGGVQLPANYRPLLKLRERRYRSKVAKIVVSNEYKEVVPGLVDCSGSRSCAL